MGIACYTLSTLLAFFVITVIVIVDVDFLTLACSYDVGFGSGVVDHGRQQRE
jgi:hypothetical protein